MNAQIPKLFNERVLIGRTLSLCLLIGCTLIDSSDMSTEPTFLFFLSLWMEEKNVKINEMPDWQKKKSKIDSFLAISIFLGQVPGRVIKMICRFSKKPHMILRILSGTPT